MTKNEFLAILKNPSSMLKEQTFDLEDVISDFPFFQAARVLYLKGLKNQNSFRYNQSLKTTAAYTTDRSILFKFITSQDFENPILKQEESNIIDELHTIDKNIIENISKEQEELVAEEYIDLEDQSKLEELFGLHQIVSHKENDVESENKVIENEFTDNFFIENTTEETSDETKLKEEVLEESNANNDFFAQSFTEEKAKEEELDEYDEIANEFLKKIEAETHQAEFNDVEESLPQTQENEVNDFSISDFLTENPVEESEVEAVEYTFTELESEESEIEAVENALPELKSEESIEESIEIPQDRESEVHRILSDPDYVFIDSKKEEIITSSSEDAEMTTESDTFEDTVVSEEFSANIEDEKEIIAEETSTEKDEIIFELLPNEIFTQTFEEETPPTVVEEIKLEMNEDFSPPVQFHRNDTRSFGEWLKLSSFKPIDRSLKPEKKETIEQKMEIIDEFISKNPKIEPIKDKISSEVQKTQDIDNEEVMTETLARVYVLQRKYADAIRAYEILSLKFPEKSSFFATQIKQIEILRKNNIN